MQRGAFFVSLIALAGLIAGCGAPEGVHRLRLAGAQIATELVQSWLDDARSPRFQTQRVEPVYLSQHGFEKLRDGEADFACVDRRVAPRELEADFSQGDIEGRRLAFYGHAFYVNRENKLDSVYAGHIRLLFRRQLTDWKELGLGEGPIHLVGPRKSDRGGEVLMRQSNIILGEPSWDVRDSPEEVIAAVAEDPLALGFASIGYDSEQVRYVGLRMERNLPPAFPSLEEIEAERYGLAKVIYVYYRTPVSPACAAALDYLGSPAGQVAIEKTHVWPISGARSVVEPVR